MSDPKVLASWRSVDCSVGCGDVWWATHGEWHCEVWLLRTGGWRYAFHCRHTRPDTEYPGAEWFTHCHGAGGSPSGSYPTRLAAMAACEARIAAGGDFAMEDALAAWRTPVGS